MSYAELRLRAFYNNPLRPIAKAGSRELQVLRLRSRLALLQLVMRPQPHQILSYPTKQPNKIIAAAAMTKTPGYSPASLVAVPRKWPARSCLSLAATDAGTPASLQISSSPAQTLVVRL